MSVEIARPSERTERDDEPNGTSWNQLGFAISQLLHHAEAIGLVRRATERTGTATGAQRALARLVYGGGLPGDEARLGIPAAGARLLVVLASSAVTADRVGARLSGDRRWLSVPVAPEELVVLVSNSPRRAGEDRAKVAATGCIANIFAVDARARIGIGAAMSAAVDLPGAAADAADAARLTDTDGSAVEVDRTWGQIVVRRLQRQLDRVLSAATPLPRLVEYDTAHGTPFAPTLARWLSNNQDVQTTARELCIHPNTLRYRLRRAADLAGLDLQDPCQRLVTQLVLASPATPAEKPAR